MRKIVFPILLFFSIFILIANSTITLTPNTQTICSTGNDSVSFSINTTAIPNNSQIVIYKNNDSIFNPYNNQGDSIGVINIDGNSSTNFLSNACPTILGIFIDACNQGIDEDANEYMVISSGNGFKVSNLGVDLPNSTGTGNGDINIGACSFASTFRQSYLDSLRTGFCNSSNLIFAGLSDSIPSNAIVIIFTGNGTSFGYNFSEYCQLGVPIYILQNNCFRATGAFANNDGDGTTCALNTASRYRLTRILNRGCTDSLVYDRCGLPVFDATNINEGDGNFVIRIKNGTDTASVAKGSIKKDSLNKCNGVVNDSLLNNYKFTYKIPTSLCNDTTYIKSVVKPTNTTGQVISNTVNFYYACVDVSTNVTRKTICSGEQTGITISSTDPNATFSWTTTGGNNTTGESAGNGNTINQTLTLSGNVLLDSLTYNITATDKGCTKTTQVKVIILKTPTKPNLGNDTVVCGAFTKTLSAGQNANWTRDGQSAGTNVANITVSQVGTYIATVSNQCGTASDTIIITQNNTPTKPNLGADLNICGTINQALNAGQLANWTRDGQSAGSNVANITATQVGTYIATVSNQCGTVSDTIAITQNNTPTKPNLGVDLNICGSISQTLNAGQLANWTRDGQSAGSNVANITATQVGTYIATVSNQCGTVSDTIVISQENVSVQITGNTEVCNGSSVTLSVAGQYDSIRWSNGATTSSINVTVPNAYSVNVYRNGCSATAQTTVTECQQQICNPTILGDTIFCNGTSITLNAGAGFDSYAWNNGQSGQTITITQGGQFIVNVSGQNCIGTDTINVRLINPPAAFNIGKDTAYCGAFTRTISTSNGEPATWSTGATATSITVNEAGTYTATISNQCGSEQAEITITQKAIPTVDLRADTSICTGASTTLDATFENATYLWNTGVETAIIEVSTEGTYSVTVTLDGCTATDSKLVSVLNPPTAFNIGNDTTYCGNFSRILSTNNANTTWSTGATGANIIVNDAGTYTATISNQCGTEQASVNIFKNELPYVSLGKDTALCYDAIELSIGQNDFQSVLWSTQEIGNSITVEDEGIYFVSVTDNNNCSNTDTINVGINCKNEVWVPNAFTPNGDNMNDVFYVRGNPKNVKVEKMIVFDRWGNKIFETGNILPDNKVFGWDGTYKGKKQQVEAYGYYVKVKYIDGSTQELKGNVTLLE